MYSPETNFSSLQTSATWASSSSSRSRKIATLLRISVTSAMPGGQRGGGGGGGARRGRSYEGPVVLASARDVHVRCGMSARAGLRALPNIISSSRLLLAAGFVVTKDVD